MRYLLVIRITNTEDENNHHDSRDDIPTSPASQKLKKRSKLWMISSRKNNVRDPLTNNIERFESMSVKSIKST